jgi:RNA polymerase sigma factor (sigma-70 family)
MTNVRQNRFLQHLHSASPTQDVAAATDGQLLEYYLARRDERSFAALVGRHGPMVWGVCCRLLSHQDAEDAFQATFLVLVRKAGSIVPRQMVGNWLYGVAHQTALKARAIAARRAMRERQVIDMPEPNSPASSDWSDLQPVLDEELSRLPQRYRAVVLLCDLEGKTRKEAARLLNVPDGTVAGWLARARIMLAKRLNRRGIALSSVALGTVLMQYGAAKVPAAVVQATIESAAKYAAAPVAAGVVSAPVANLTEGVLKAMLLKKLKVALMVVLSAGIVGAGVLGVALQPTAGEEPKGKPTKDGREIKAGKLTNEPAGPDADLRQLKAEVDRLRADVDALKKQLQTAKPGTTDPIPDAKPALSVKVYPIKELITRAEDEQPSVIRIITNIIEPESWNLAGGPGSIEYFSAGQSLVVNQRADVHKQIGDLLTELENAKAKGAADPKK